MKQWMILRKVLIELGAEPDPLDKYLQFVRKFELIKYKPATNGFHCHHIIPRSLITGYEFGVNLTIGEHFRAHYLLALAFQKANNKYWYTLSLTVIKMVDWNKFKVVSDEELNVSCDAMKMAARQVLSNNGKKSTASLRAAYTSLTLEQRREISRKGAMATNAAMTPEQRSIAAAKASAAAYAAMTPEQRSIAAAKASAAAYAATTPEQRKAAAIKAATASHAARTSEQRKAAAIKAAAASVAALRRRQAASMVVIS